jgi:hypothetical protein
VSLDPTPPERETVEHMAARTGWPVELLAAPVVFDPHAVTRTPHPWGVAWQCACGRWEGAATGRGSAVFVEGDYRRHRAEEEAAARGE